MYKLTYTIFWLELYFFKNSGATKILGVNFQYEVYVGYIITYIVTNVAEYLYIKKNLFGLKQI